MYVRHLGMYMYHKTATEAELKYKHPLEMLCCALFCFGMVTM